MNLHRREAPLTRSILVITAPFLLAGCALTGAMPPMSRADAVAYRGAAPAPIPAARPSAPRPIPVLAEYDPTLDVTRWWVTTHRGLYFLWIRKPRLTFYFEAPGRAVAAPPETVELAFRTQSPQDIVDNHLTFVCAGEARPTDVVPRFSEVQSINTVTQFLVYSLPLAQFVPLQGCSELEVTVGKIHAAFSPDQLAALRDLAGRMYPPVGTD